ncbi:hypothetical protein KIN20_005971 [Parelaphostrongylus tenuis]|uniref:Uncharacterized protein n=1 Tax=Parelaphostrongylus tenuis TaxID=148309 RepID=A0AAD5QGC9_PARTN|nr:hypothetical protein KIN20_005971 [Parelaphostrongylus tenuis]
MTRKRRRNGHRHDSEDRKRSPVKSENATISLERPSTESLSQPVTSRTDDVSDEDVIVIDSQEDVESSPESEVRCWNIPCLT